MEKLSIEEFKVHKQKMMDLINSVIENQDGITSEEEERMLAEYEASLTTILGYDLSEIPEAEWEGLYIAQTDNVTLDLSQTRANIDFSVLSEYDSQGRKPYRDDIILPNFKGCKLINFPFDKVMYTPEMFDEEFIASNPDRFLSEEVPAELREIFYRGELTFEHLRKSEEIRQKFLPDQLVYTEKDIYELFSRAEFLKLDLEFLDAVKYWAKNKIQERTDLKTANEVMEYLYEAARKELFASQESRDSSFYARPSKLGEEFRRRNPTLFLPDSAPEVLKDSFNTGNLYLIQYINNIEYFEGVDTTLAFSRDEKNVHDYFGEDMYELFKRYGKYIYPEKSHYYQNAFEIPNNPQNTLEEKRQVLTDTIKKRLEQEPIRNIEEIELLSEILPVEDIVGSSKYASIISTVGIDKLKEFGYTDMEVFKDGLTRTEELAKFSNLIPNIALILPKDFKLPDNYTLEDALSHGIEDITVFSKDFSQDLAGAKELLDKGVPINALSFGRATEEKRDFITKYGIENLIEFDNETKLFSIIQIDGINHQLEMLAVQDKNSSKARKGLEIKVTDYESFRARVYELLCEARESIYTRGILTTRDSPAYDHMEGKFREEHPEIFIEGVSDVIKDAFYYGILRPSHIQAEPDAVEMLRGKNLNLAFNQKIEFPGLRTANGTFAGVISENFVEYVSEKFGEDKFFELSIEYGSLIDKGLGIFMKTDFESFEEFRTELENNIYSSIIKGLQYSEKVPQRFKDKHPELFLPEEVPIHIKEKFYKGQLSFEDIREYPELATILLEKNIDVGFSSQKKHNWGASDTRNNTYKYKDFFEKVAKEDILKLSAKYGKYLLAVTPEYLQDGYTSFEDLDEKVKISIREGILSKKFKYADNAPEFFKQEHPEMFLSEEAPELLKLSYYSDYQGKAEPYINHSSSNYALNINFIKQHPEFRRYLEGKKLDLVTEKLVGNLATQFTTQEIIEMVDMDDEALALLAVNPQTVEKLRKNIDERPKDKENIVKCPGYILYYSEEKKSKFNFSEYKELVTMSKFTVSDNYRRGTAEQILTTMYDFLGYASSKEVLKLPELDEARVEEVIRSHGQAFNELYEERFKLKGNLRVLNTLFEKFVPQLPSKKGSLNVYKLLNQKLEEGYNGSLEELLFDLMKENNLSFDKDKLKLVSKAAIEINTSEKIELILDKVAVDVETGIEETVANKKILKDILMNIYRKTLNEHEGLDETTIRNMLEQEFARTREDGGTFYSPHITDHLEDLMKITKSINDSTEYGFKVNKSVVDILKTEKEKIGQGWIKKLLELRQELSKDELENLTKKLYGANQEHTISATRFVRLKDTSEIGMEKAYVFLKELELPGIFTYEKGEQMFAGLSKPYSENFKNFFMRNQKEVLRKPEYYTVFQRMHAEFERIIEDPHISTRFKAGAYTLDELLVELNRTTYPNVKDGEYELEYVARKAGLETDYWPKAQEVYEKMKQRESQTIPPVEFNGKKYRGRILRIDDPLHLVIGNITTCCQRFGRGQPGEPSMLHSALERNGSVFIVEEIDELGRVVGGPVAQSWTWRNGDRICFDNVEIPDTLESELKSKKAHDDILVVYMETAKKMMDIDKKMLNKMLTEGKITKEQYNQFVVKEITVGTGCDDLINNLSPEYRKLLTDSNAIKPIEASTAYETVSGEMKTPWIDSANQLVLASDEAAREKGIHSTYSGEVLVEYTKIRETLRRTGRNINSDLIKRMKEMVQRAGKQETSAVGKLERNLVSEFFEDTEDYLDNENSISLSCSSNDDWYILTKEEGHSITIIDSLITSGTNQIEAQKPIDDKLAKYEYLNEMLAIMQLAEQKGKVLKLNPEREGEYLKLEPLVQNGVLTIEEGKVKIAQPEKISELRQSLSAQIEKGRTDRITGEEQDTEDKSEDER